MDIPVKEIVEISAGTALAYCFILIVKALIDLLKITLGKVGDGIKESAKESVKQLKLSNKIAKHDMELHKEILEAMKKVNGKKK